MIWGYVQNAPDHGGAAGDDWLRDVIQRFGPLTHHIQHRASIVMDALTANGIGIDQARREEKEAQVRTALEEYKARLVARGYRVAEEGGDQKLQEILTRFHRDHPDIPLKRTASGEHWSTAEEDLAELAEHDSFFADYIRYRHAEKLVSSYLRKMGPARIHPRFGFLLETGRTSCSAFTLQNLPNEKDLLKADPGAATVRGCCVPAEDRVFIDCDYRQLELVLLAYAWAVQFGRTPHLAPLLNADHDVLRLIAAVVQGKDPSAVTQEVRDSVKAVAYGRAGGMGVHGLRQVARARYGIDLTDAEVQQRIQAYHQLCPELDAFLQDEVECGLVLAHRLDLTPAQYDRATGVNQDPPDPESTIPAGWLGGMLLKVLRDREPMTNQGAGRPYTAAEIAFFWQKAQQLPLSLPPHLQDKLRQRQPDRELWQEVRDWAGRRPVFTVTGRLRANATFCSSRNTIFQGAAADGAILALWLVWRAVYQIVNFVHDQLVVESPADDAVPERVAHLEHLMKQGMALVAPGMLVKVKTVVTRSLNKEDLDPRYDPTAREWIDASNRVVETSQPAATP
jgi:DNA polymerase I-like protein with 3'-5' exonuclease and polymerase domains